MAADPTTEPAAWNAVASGYDEVWTRALPELTEAVVAAASPTPAMTVLDVATGPGTFALAVAPRVARVVAIDFAEKMIAQLRTNIERTKLTNIEPHVMDGMALSFGDAAFDAVVSMFGWFMFPDRARGLAEFRRVVQPGGRVLVTSWAPPDQNLGIGAGLFAMREALPDLPRPKGPLPTQIPEVLAEEMRTAGFADVSTSMFRSSVRFPSVAAYWDTMERAGAPQRLLKAKLGETAWQAASERARNVLLAKYGDGELALDVAAIFTTGVRS